jgi:hypothetical protein
MPWRGYSYGKRLILVPLVDVLEILIHAFLAKVISLVIIKVLTAPYIQRYYVVRELSGSSVVILAILPFYSRIVL